MAEEGSVTKSPPEADGAAQWRSATTQVRDTIKYVVAGFAAVGAILVGTAPLTGIGTISGLWWIAALLGAIAAIGGVIVAVWKASDVLLPTVATLDVVEKAAGGTELARLRDNVLGGKEGLFRSWGGSVSAFRSQRDLEYSTLMSIDAYSPPEDEKAELSETRTTVVARIEQLNRAAETALAGAQYAATRDCALDRRKWIALAATSVAVGAGLFTWAVSRPDDKDVVVKPQRAARAVVTFTAAGRKDLGDLVGSACGARAPALILNGGPAGPWEVVTTGDGGCSPARFTLTPEQGEPVSLEVKRVFVKLTATGATRLAPVLGIECAAQPFAALDLGVDDSRSQLVSLATDDCSAVRFSLSDGEGAASR